MSHHPYVPINYLQPNKFGAFPNDLFSKNEEISSSLQNTRIIQKHWIYWIGLSSKWIEKDQDLKNYEYLGQYGKIEKLVVNKSKIYNSNNPNGPSYSCYVTYSNFSESSLAILTLDNAIIDNHIIKASFGTTKYCTNYLRNAKCLNRECLYLHSIADQKDIVQRDEMNNKGIFNQQQYLAVELSGVLRREKREEIEKEKDMHTVFPNAFTIYSKDIVKKFLSVEATENQGRRGNKSKNNNVSELTRDNSGGDWSCESGVTTARTSGPTKKHITLSSFLKLFKQREHSRFPVITSPGSSSRVDIPEKVNTFLKQDLIKAIIKCNCNDNVSEYYFGNTARDTETESEDSWASLINVLDLSLYFNARKGKNNLKQFTNNRRRAAPKQVCETDDFIVIDQFHSV